MEPQKLQEYILSGIEKRVYADKIELYVPFHFQSGDRTPLCLTWDKDGVLSDGGRTFAELKKRVGDTAPYAEQVRGVLHFEPVELLSGHILAVRHFQTVLSAEGTYTDYRAGLSRLIAAISLIDAIGAVRIKECGEVSL